MTILGFENNIKDFWLTKEETRVIINFTKTNVLNLDKETLDFIYEENDLNELNDFVKKISSCAIFIKIDKFLFKHIKPLVDLELDRVFFDCYCVNNLFLSIDEKIKKYEEYTKIIK